MFKYLSILLIVLALFVIGCTDDSNIVSPAGGSVSNNDVLINPNWITLPQSTETALKKDVAVSKIIYGWEDSNLEINTRYWSRRGRISIYANAEFKKDSFKGQRNVTMSVNDEFGSTDFSPSGTWAKPVIFNLKITGIDLRNVDPSQVTFVYMAPNGSYHEAKYDSIYVNTRWGILQVVNAELPHFSRWGFVN
jgi:uncharacterized membrane protein YciS (DUF1049 family)